MNTVLLLTLILCTVVLIEGIASVARLGRRLDAAASRLPLDPETGLLDHRAFLSRATQEIKRASRMGTNLWLGVWTITEGDTDRFGRITNDSLTFPEIGFRLSDRVFCVIRPDMNELRRRDIITRLASVGPREKYVIGESVWTSGDSDAKKLLDTALQRMGDAASVGGRPRRLRGSGDGP